ncbi:MAG: hypothetical protein JWM62_2080 [Frankiales bacterium]|nr:hypothetical protein [Frankiales bacterium]
MIVLGLILLVLCLVLGAGIVLSNTDSLSAEAFGVSLSNVSIGGLFLAGTAVGALAMLGLGLMLVGAARKRTKKLRMKREVHHVRSEQEVLAEENARLQAELEQERTAESQGSLAADGTDTRGKHAR